MDVLEEPVQLIVLKENQVPLVIDVNQKINRGLLPVKFRYEQYTNYLLKAGEGCISNSKVFAKRIEDDLYVLIGQLEQASIVIIDYFSTCMDLGCLVGVCEEGDLYEFLPEHAELQALADLQVKHGLVRLMFDKT